MKVAVVGLATFDQMAGGSARYLSGMVDALRTAGHEVRVATGASVIGATGYVEPGIAGQVRRTLRRLVLAQPRAVGLVVRHRPDLVNVHFAPEGLGAVIAARLVSVPVVVTFHGPWAREAVATGMRGRWPLSTKLRTWIERRVYRAADRCIVMSEAFRDLLHREYGVPLSRIRVIPAGIDAASQGPLMDRSEARSALGLDDAPTIVTVRRLVARMGIDILLDALADPRIPLSTRLVIVGTGPERDTLEARAISLGIDGRVTFMGRVDEGDLSAAYAAGDLCVVPSRELEGFGYVVLEAYLAGTQVLATRIGGLVEVVGGFDPRSLVPPNAAGLAEGIVKALRKPLVDRESCRTYALRFDWSIIRPRIEAVFAESMDSGHAP